MEHLRCLSCMQKYCTFWTLCVRKPDGTCNDSLLQQSVCQKLEALQHILRTLV